MKKPVYGTKEYYRQIGQKGGKATVPKGFAMTPELAKRAGRKGKRKKEPLLSTPK